MSRKLSLVAAPQRGPAVVGAGERLPQPVPLRQAVRGVVFDICNVLYDDTVWRRWVLKVLGRLGLHTNYRSFFRVWDRDYLAEVHRGQSTFHDAFRTFLAAAGLSAGQIEEVEAACQTRRRELQRTARPLPGVRSTLAGLHRRGLALAAVANSEHPAPVLEEQLRRFDVAEVFTAVISSIELRRVMPEPDCYLAALRAVGLSAGEVAFVGHDTAVLAGATAVGMPTVAFNYDCDARADVYLGRFDELLDLLAPPRPEAAAG